MSDTEDTLPTESEVHESILSTFRCRLEDADLDLFNEIELTVSYGEVNVKAGHGTTDMGLEVSRRCAVKYTDLYKLLEACLDEDSGPEHLLVVTTVEFVGDTSKPSLVDAMLQISLDGPLGLREWLAVHLKAVLMLAEIYGIEDYRHYQERPQLKSLPRTRAKSSTSN